MSLLELEERAPLLDLQAKILGSLEYIRRLCYQSLSSYFFNYWVDRIVDSFTIAGKEYSIDQTVYQVLIRLFDECSALILSHVTTSKHFAHDLSNLANELHDYLSNTLVALDCAYQHMRLSVIDNEDILRYDFGEFIEQKECLDPEDSILINTKLEAQFLLDLDNRLTLWVTDEIEKRKSGQNFSKKKEAELKDQVIHDIHFKTYKQQVEADLKIRKNRQLLQIIELSLSDPEQLREQGTEPIKCTLLPEEVHKCRETYELKDLNETRIRTAQKSDTNAIRREGLPMLLRAVAWLETVYTEIIKLREQKNHEVSTLYYTSARKFEGMFQGLSETKPSESKTIEDTESLY